VSLPPYWHKELPEPAVDRLEVDDRPVTGRMAAHVGEQYRVDDFLGTACSVMLDFSLFDDDLIVTPALRRSHARVRAFRIPSLEGRTVSAGHESALAAAVDALLRSVVPGVAWTVTLNSVTLRKSLMFETILPAPIDETTGMPMALQLFGNVISIDGVTRGTGAWDTMAKAMFTDAMARIQADQLPPALAAPFTVRIDVATYANVQNCGVGVPFHS
jgi:hypothetical protein